MTGESKNKIAAAIKANPKLEDAIVRLVENPELQGIHEALSTNPELQKHVAALLEISRSEDVALRRLDAAEAQLIDASRNVAHATLQAWASKQATIVEERVQAERPKGLQKDQKKSSVSIRQQGKSRSRSKDID